MDRIQQEAHHRQRMLEYRKSHSTKEAAIRYKTSEKAVKKWWKRWGGTPESLQDQSLRPKNSPRKSTEAELKKFWWLQTDCGQTEEAKPKAKEKRRPKLYQRAAYPGQKVQKDVKYVPSECAVDGQKYYQFTAVDECTKWTFREMCDEHSTFSTHGFLMKLIASALFLIRKVQSDSVSEFTNDRTNTVKCIIIDGNSY